MYAIVMTEDNYPIKVFTDRDQAAVCNPARRGRFRWNGGFKIIET